MKIAKKDIALVMVIVALLAAFCAYKFSLSSNLDKVEDEESKQASLQQQIDEVKARADQVQKMEKEIADWQVEVSNKIKPFHAAYLYEDGIMYLDNLEKQGEKEETENYFKVRIDGYSVGESAITNTVNGQGSFKGMVYTSGQTNYNYAYKIDGYDELKNFINYIISETDGSGVKSLDTMTFEVTPEDSHIEGDISMTVFSISDGTNTYKPQNLENVEQQIESETIWGDFGEGDEQNDEE